MLITIIIMIILCICIKVLIDDINCDALVRGDQTRGDQTRGDFTNALLIGDSFQQYGSESLIGGLGSSIGGGQYSIGSGRQYSIEDAIESGEDTGVGNFTNRPRPDPFYLEDIETVWADNCMQSACSGKLIGRTCDVNSPNPKKEYQRSYGGSTIVYDDMGLAKDVYLKDSVIYVPWSDTYNNIMPANPIMR